MQKKRKEDGRKEERGRKKSRGLALDIMSILWKKLRLAGSSAGSRRIYMLLQLPLPAATAPFVAREISGRPQTHNTHTKKSLSRPLNQPAAFVGCRDLQKAVYSSLQAPPSAPPPSPPSKSRGAETTTEALEYDVRLHDDSSCVRAVFFFFKEAPGRWRYFSCARCSLLFQ